MEQHEPGIAQRKRRPDLRRPDHQPAIHDAPPRVWRPYLFLTFAACALIGLAAVLPAADHSAELAQHAKTAQAAIAANDTEVAARELRAMLKIDPANASVRANLGMVEFSIGDYAEASRQFEAVLSAAPSLWSASAFLGMCKVRLGASTEGQKLLEESLDRVTDKALHVQAGLELVKSYSELGMPDKAEPVLQQLEAFDPDNPEVLYALYRLHTELASAALHKLSAANPDSALVHEVLGQNLMAQEQYRQAAEEFRKAIERVPHLTGLRYQLGEALYSEGRTEENRSLAEKEFQAELQANPHDPDALFKLAQIAVDRGKWDAAMAFVKQAIAARPSFAAAHELLAKIMAGRDDVAGALAELEAAEKLAPERKTIHYQLAQLYRKQGRTADSDRETAAFRRLSAAEPTR